MDQSTEATTAETSAPTEAAGATEGGTTTVKAMRRQPCPCGSGKKFKNCHEGAEGYEVATEQTENHVQQALPAAGLKGLKGTAGPKHFPAQQQKNIPSQRMSAPTHRRKV